MKKTRVYQIAEEVGMSNKDILAKLKELVTGENVSFLKILFLPEREALLFKVEFRLGKA